MFRFKTIMEIYQTDNSKNSPLMIAIKNDDYKSFKLLLNNKKFNSEYHINHSNLFGNSALMLAIILHQEKYAIDILKNKYVRFDLCNKDGETALILAVKENFLNIIKLMIKTNKNLAINHFDSSKKSAIMHAFDNSHAAIDIINCLLDIPECRVDIPYSKNNMEIYPKNYKDTADYKIYIEQKDHKKNNQLITALYLDLSSSGSKKSNYESKISSVDSTSLFGQTSTISNISSSNNYDKLDESIDHKNIRFLENLKNYQNKYDYIDYENYLEFKKFLKKSYEKSKYDNDYCHKIYNDPNEFKYSHNLVKFQVFQEEYIDNIKKYIDTTILIKACKLKNIKIINKILSRNNILLNEFDSDQNNALIYAMKINDTKIFEKLLKHSSLNLYKMNKNKNTCLSLIVSNMTDRFYKFFINFMKKLDKTKYVIYDLINNLDLYDRSLIFYANPKIIMKFNKYFELDFGIIDCEGNNWPMYMFNQFKYLEYDQCQKIQEIIYDIIINKFVNINQYNNKNETLLHIILKNFQYSPFNNSKNNFEITYQIIFYLLSDFKMKNIIEKISNDGYTILMLSCLNKMKNVAIKILEYQKCNINYTNERSESALSICIDNKLWKIKDMIYSNENFSY